MRRLEAARILFFLLPVMTTNQVDGRIMATPAFVDRSIILRTDTHLYRIEQPTPRIVVQDKQGLQGP